MEIRAKCQLWRIFQIAMRQKVMREGKIAVARGDFRTCDALVDMDRLIPRRRANEPQKRAKGLARGCPLQHRIGGHNCACVDERIARITLFQLQKQHRVKRMPRRLAPDARPKPVTQLAKCQGQHEYLGHGLNRKWHLRIARHHRRLTGARNGDAELVWIDACQLRDVIRHLASVLRGAGNFGDLVQKRLQRGQCLRHSGFPEQEVRNHAQAGLLAFLGVKLRANNRIAPDNGRDGPGIVDMRQQMRGVLDPELIGMHEIGMIAGADPVKNRMRVVDDQICGTFSAGSEGAIASTVPRIQSKPAVSSYSSPRVASICIPMQIPIKGRAWVITASSMASNTPRWS